MKTLYFFLILISITFTSFGQITTQVIKANFGVEADLQCNYYNGVNQPGNDDWFGNGSLGSGNFVIDTTGAAALIASYAVPANRMASYSRFMRVAPYTTVNNRIWLDAIYHRDFHGTDSTVFAAGSNKNGMSPAAWTTPIAQNIPDKNDILDAFTHIRRAGPNLTDSLWMFGAISIENTTGNRYFDFELYQTDIRFVRSTLSFAGYGPNDGHTAWQFDAAGNILKSGDIIFTAEFGTASITMLEARIWVHKSALTAVAPTAFTWGGAFDGASSSSMYGYANILPKTTGAFYSGLQSGNNVWAGPFQLVRQDNSLSTNYIAKQFMEFSVNLTKLGLDPGRYGIDPCGSPFRRVLIKTRSSTSFTAELKDFIAPFSLFNYEPVQTDAMFTYYCGAMFNSTINVTNPNPDLEYTWTTQDGTIVGPTTGTSITVNAPGTYAVHQQFDLLCPVHSSDSITIRFDSICYILNVDRLRLAGNISGDQAKLKWEVGNNEIAARYDLEYSYDNYNFERLISLNATDNFGDAVYNHSHSVTNINQPYITYRVKVLDDLGRFTYSNRITLRLANEKLPPALVFPNPVKGKSSLSVHASSSSITEVFVNDTYGRQVLYYKIPTNKGENIIPLPGLENLPAAIYMVKVKSIDGTSTQKVHVQK